MYHYDEKTIGTTTQKAESRGKKVPAEA